MTLEELLEEVQHVPMTTIPVATLKLLGSDILLEEDLMVGYDASGSIGRRYARADEVGTPICVTIDYKTLEDGTVTLRDLYTWGQVRVKADALPSLLRDYIRGRLEFHELGPSVSEKSG